MFGEATIVTILISAIAGFLLRSMLEQHSLMRKEYHAARAKHLLMIRSIAGEIAEAMMKEMDRVAPQEVAIISRTETADRTVQFSCYTTAGL